MEIDGNSRRRVLIPSDDRNFLAHWVEGYRAANFEVVTGSLNFEWKSGRYDIIHHLWPEELCGWRPPTTAQLERIRGNLRWWRGRAVNVLTTNNLYPHRHEGNAMFKQLMAAFYENCPVVTHYSEASLKLVLAEFPESRNCRQVVTTPFNYELLLPRQTGSGSCRAELGLDSEDFVILIFGALRKWEEVQLIRDAYDRVRTPNKRLLMAGRFGEPGFSWRQRWHRLSWNHWLRRRRAVIRAEYIPEEEIYKYMNSADVVIVPRLADLSSGIPGLAMTFGGFVIAPNHGAFPDYLRGSDNLLYQSGDVASLAAAIDKAATLDRVNIGRRNRELAAKWAWDGIVRDCINAAEQAAPAMRTP